MYIVKWSLKLFGLGIFVLMLSTGCTNSIPTPQATSISLTASNTPVPTVPPQTPSPTDTLTPTPTPTLKPTATATLTAAPTSTATATPTATLAPTRVRPATAQPAQPPTQSSVQAVAAARQPGTSSQNRCISTGVTGTSGGWPPGSTTNPARYGVQPAVMCVTTVEVLADGSLKVNVTWSLESVHREWRYVGMNSQGEYQNSYLRDNLGNRYTSFEISGAARDPAQLPNNHPTAAGWYRFPAPASGATSFALRDDEQDVNIDGLVIQ